jgi:type IV secretion system protein VirD4
MERRVMGNYHARCEVGENSEITSKSYLSLSKHFLISLIIQQLYREILSVADEKGGKLDNRVMFYLDEIGTIPPI